MSFVRTPVARNIFAAFKAQSRTLSTSSRCLVAGSTRHGNDPEILEKGKQDVLRKHKKDSKDPPHWHEEVASDAEAFVKSIRDEIDASHEAIAKLQEKTKNDPSKQK